MIQKISRVAKRFFDPGKLEIGSAVKHDVFVEVVLQLQPKGAHAVWSYSKNALRTVLLSQETSALKDTKELEVSAQERNDTG
jgi:hypothetical protein